GNMLQHLGVLLFEGAPCNVFSVQFLTLGTGVGIAIYYPAYALSSESVCIIFTFDKNEAAISTFFFIKRQNSLTCCTGARKAIQHQRIFTSRNSQYSFQETHRLWRGKRSV